MIKDIIIPTATELNIGLIPMEECWDMYLMNTSKDDLINILIVTEAKSETNQTSKLRYLIETLNAESFIKVETILENVAQMKNTVMISYYKGADIYEQEFSFSVNELHRKEELPLIGIEGYLISE